VAAKSDPPPLPRQPARPPAGSQSKDIAGREIVATRVFDAPRELVFRMWTEPQHVAQWWGPRGFTNTIHEMDVRPGGVWRFVMHGPDGVDYRNKIVYTEVVRPERIAYDHVSGPKFHATATFEDEGGGKTRLTVRMVFDTAAERDKVAREFGAVEGLSQTLQRLGETLAADTAGAKGAPSEATTDAPAGAQGGAQPGLRPGETVGPPFVISRVFDAPRELVWKAWTERDRLMQWFGPKGFTMDVATLDLRPGGKFHYHLVSPDGGEMWGRFVYREIVRPERIVWVNSFSDPAGGLSRPPFDENWPPEMLSIATFAEREGRTTVTLRWSALNAAEAQRATFDANHESMKGGWTGTFDQLAEYLAKS